ncbi:protein argonaute-2-like isoform X2 [Chrysoperla carnea]|uniref:protein argonaute-2-like isoform X2 n=1 Tax=Chrysoperla carnea TaxID=189513 RepID=UPI001D06DD60|nr:protein argonaute-2-like isoform X2 [Chrysoperla carnea]
MEKKNKRGKSGRENFNKSTEPTQQKSSISDLKPEKENVRQKSDGKSLSKQDVGLNKGWDKPVEPTHVPRDDQRSEGGQRKSHDQRSTSWRKDQHLAGDQYPQSDKYFKGYSKQNVAQFRRGDQQSRGHPPSDRQQQKREDQQDQHLAGDQYPQSDKCLKGYSKQNVGQCSDRKQQKRERQISSTRTIPKNEKKYQGVEEVQASTSTSIKSPETNIIQKSKKGGTKGRLCRIETNYLKLRLAKLKTTAYHYDVEFTPQKGPKWFYKLAWENFRLKYFPNNHPVFDGRKNLYSAVSLIDVENKPAVMEGEVSIEDDNGRSISFQIKLQFTSEIDLTTLVNYMAGQNMIKPQRAIQCLDIVIQHAPSIIFTRVGRSFFSKPSENIKLTGGMELWHGTFVSAILGSEPLLNIDVAHKAFPIDQTVIQLLLELMDSGFRSDNRSSDRLAELRQELRPYIYEKFKTFMKGLKIKYEIPQKVTTKRIAKVVNIVGSARKSKFKLNDGQEMTVEEYFVKEKNYRLLYPNLPCLHVGNPNKKIYYPAELCTIVGGQVINKKLNEEQTTNMIRKTATSTYERKQKIMSSVNKVNFNGDLCMKEFGLEVDQKFVEVNSRILDPPYLSYRNNDTKPRDGSWRPSHFYDSPKLIHWIILSLDSRVRKEDLRKFEDMVINTGKQQMGMIIENPQTFICLDIVRSTSDDIDKLFSEFHKTKINLVFIVLPSQRTSDVYCQVKQKAELKYGILTQCIKSRTMQRMNPSTVSNILLKVNAKLNGTNHVLKTPPRILRDERCMIVGADVTHPSPDQQTVPSVAAVAASCDLDGVVYNFHSSLQRPTAEIIEDLGLIIKKQLIQFKANTKEFPSSILFFRDGVSKGQFPEVRLKEIPAIINACRELSPTYRPKISFLVVQKRHHTRFFPIRQADGDRKNGNVKPGTIVDSVITFPDETDFYLCSHASLQGVSRPTRYCVLLDEHNFDEDDIQELTYYLCHLFARCTRSVSYPAPTYYAHLAAFRARNYLYGYKINMENLKATEKKLLVQNDFWKNSPMFFV